VVLFLLIAIPHHLLVAIPPGGIKGVSDKVVSGKLRLTFKTDSDVRFILRHTSAVPFLLLSR